MKLHTKLTFGVAGLLLLALATLIVSFSYSPSANVVTPIDTAEACTIPLVVSLVSQEDNRAAEQNQQWRKVTATRTNTTVGQLLVNGTRTGSVFDAAASKLPLNQTRTMKIQESDFYIDIALTGTTLTEPLRLAIIDAYNNGDVLFPVGATKVEFTLTPFDDTRVEGVEAITHTLDASAGYQFTRNARGVEEKQTTIWIEDNDGSGLSLSPQVATTNEDGSLADGVFRLSFTQPTTKATQVKLRLTGTATLTADYTFNPALTDEGGELKQITVPTNTRTFDIKVKAIDDTNETEGDETVTLTLRGNPGQYEIRGNNTATITILDNKRLPKVSIHTTQSVAKRSGQLGEFEIRRADNSTKAATIRLTPSGTATPEDYVPFGNYVSLPANTTSMKLPISAVPYAEGDKTLTLTLAVGADYTAVNPTSATIQIQDDYTQTFLPEVSSLIGDLFAGKFGLSKAAALHKDQGANVGKSFPRCAEVYGVFVLKNGKRPMYPVDVKITVLHSDSDEAYPLTETKLVYKDHPQNSEELRKLLGTAPVNNKEFPPTQKTTYFIELAGESKHYKPQRYKVVYDMLKEDGSINWIPVSAVLEVQDGKLNVEAKGGTEYLATNYTINAIENNTYTHVGESATSNSLGSSVTKDLKPGKYVIAVPRKIEKTQGETVSAVYSPFDNEVAERALLVKMQGSNGALLAKPQDYMKYRAFEIEVPATDRKIVTLNYYDAGEIYSEVKYDTTFFHTISIAAAHPGATNIKNAVAQQLKQGRTAATVLEIGLLPPRLNGQTRYTAHTFQRTLAGYSDESHADNLIRANTGGKPLQTGSITDLGDGRYDTELHATHAEVCVKVKRGTQTFFAGLENGTDITYGDMGHNVALSATHQIHIDNATAKVLPLRTAPSTGTQYPTSAGKYFSFGDRSSTSYTFETVPRVTTMAQCLQKMWETPHAE